MIAVGNDIVALERHSGRSGQPVFYSKIITEAEKGIYCAGRFPHLPFEHFVWLCWAVKEAAFKCIKRADPDALYWGPRIRITELIPFSNLSCAPGEGRLDIGDLPLRFHGYTALARFGRHRLQAWAIANDDCVLAVSTEGETFCPDSFARVRWGIRKIDSNDRTHQSSGVRSFVLEKLQQLLPGRPLTVHKAPGGYPIIHHGDQPLDLGLSFSHHADLVSYAFLLP